MKTLTIQFTSPTVTPTNGFRVGYRIKNSTDPYTMVSPNPTASPVSIPGLPDATQYEGYIRSDCGGTLSAQQFFDTESVVVVNPTPIPRNKLFINRMTVPIDVYDSTGTFTTIQPGGQATVSILKVKVAFTDPQGLPVYAFFEDNTSGQVVVSIELTSGAESDYDSTNTQITQIAIGNNLT